MNPAADFVMPMINLSFTL